MDSQMLLRVIEVLFWPFVIGWIVLWLLQKRGPTVRERVVRIRGGKVTSAKVSLDEPKQRAVAILVADGWKRAAAVSALEHVRWQGYPEPAEMVLSAWESMPSYRA